MTTSPAANVVGRAEGGCAVEVGGHGHLSTARRRAGSVRAAWVSGGLGRRPGRRGRWRGGRRQVGRGVGVGGASANGGSSPTIALGWMLRSWFLLPAPSSWRVRMCHGAPGHLAGAVARAAAGRSQ